MSACLERYTLSFKCSKCGYSDESDVTVNIPFTSPSQRYCVDYVNAIDAASDLDFLVGDNGEMVCYNCVSKMHEKASLPTITEHNPSLARR